MAFFMYPDIGMLFLVSPIACAGVIIFLLKINPKDIDHDAARGLKGHENNHSDSIPDLYNLTNTDGTPKQQKQKQQVSTMTPTPKNKYGWGIFGTPSGPVGNPSFNFDYTDDNATPHDGGPSSPLALLKDTTLLTFIIIVFFFHMSNGTVLPLVMQTLAIGEGRIGILLSGLCIIVAQIFMVGSAKVCGDYSGVWGRKIIFLVGLFSVPIRCLILYILTGIKNGQEETSVFLQVIILSTQVLDGVGAGVFGTMYILVTSDISAGTGRFSLTLGLTSAAMSIGGTVSGYLGQAIAQDLGYQNAFMILGVMACIPAAGYLVFMPETLHGRKGLTSTKDGMSVIEEEGRSDYDKAVVV